jgi:hypothetical protein
MMGTLYSLVCSDPDQFLHQNSPARQPPTRTVAGMCVPSFNGLFAQAATISTTYKKAIANNW